MAVSVVVGLYITSDIYRRNGVLLNVTVYWLLFRILEAPGSKLAILIYF